ncbi:Cystathionine gamma-synthase [Liberibacter crescens BT-1]|uniref:Cystathionine gamma-synthase n=1 Tax=Liberibacter crescens (strain BT-1) TaxID=1215343 RepID=L0EUK8_LIBCB|nr:cystathionine gamma-synthase [Liberibacter crescens]AGA64056.1 Cystathionine gamma-synthase [Liberibacter crescens BT-1]AMC12356.1 cystathionine gamma-synthase [Liberibacter crescens]
MCKFDITTQAVHAGIESDTQFHSVIPPLYLSTNYLYKDIGQPGPYDYSRGKNPTRDLLGDTLAKMEGGSSCIITSSGMAALGLVLELIPDGGTILSGHDCYGGTWRLLDAWSRKGRYNVHFIDFTDPSTVNKAFSYKPALIWIETPSNPLLRIIDIRHIAQIAHENGAICVVDNTFLSPILQRPLELGADIVVHSTTKYINGHSDVIGGAVITRDVELGNQLKWWANCIGFTGSAFDSYLVMRGLRTLGPRFRVHQENTEVLINFLNEHPAVKHLYWPGLKKHPGHEIALKQQSGFGAIFSFELFGDETTVKAFLKSLKLFSLAESLGGVESLITHPASMTHSAMGAEVRKKAGISDQLLRLSIGLEAITDLKKDLEDGLTEALKTLE